MAHKLTKSQMDHLAEIKRIGGTIERGKVRFSFTVPGSRTPVRGLSNTTVANLAKLGHLVEGRSQDGAEYPFITYTLTAAAARTA